MVLKSLDKKELKNIKDVLVKLSKVFKSCSIINTSLGISQVISLDELEFILVTLKTKYTMAFSPLADDGKMIYIPDINAFKTQIQAIIDGKCTDYSDRYVVLSPSDELFDKSMGKVETYNNHVKSLEYSKLQYSDGKLSVLFDENMTFDTPLELNGRSLSITTGKCMFPYCNKNNLNDFMYQSTILYYGNDIYQFNLLCDMPEMDVYTAYRFI